jgi:tetratricopeptide (TPR) repeat protein
VHFVAAIEGMPKLVAARRAANGFKALDDRRRCCEALFSLAATCASVGEFEEAEAALAEASAVEDPLSPPRMHWFAANQRSRVHTYRGDAAAYRASVREELPFAEQAGSPCQAANARLNLADAAMMAGDWDDAIALGRKAVEEVRALDLPQMLAVGLLNLFAALMRKGDLQAARAAAIDALPVVWQNKLLGYMFCHLSLLAAKLSQFQCAAKMLGYLDAWFRVNELTPEPSEVRSTHFAAEILKADLSLSQCSSLKRAGANLTDAQAYALAEAMLIDPGQTGDRTDALQFAQVRSQNAVQKR